MQRRAICLNRKKKKKERKESQQTKIGHNADGSLFLYGAQLSHFYPM